MTERLFRIRSTVNHGERGRGVYVDRAGIRHHRYGDTLLQAQGPWGHALAQVLRWRPFLPGVIEVWSPCTGPGGVGEWRAWDGVESAR